MTVSGLTAGGFSAKTLTQIVDDMVENQRAVISPTWDPSSESPTGQLNGITARQIALVWELIEDVYLSLDRDSAEGDQLDKIGKLFGVPRGSASPSEVNLDADLDAGTTLLAGVHFAESATVPGQLWTPVEDYTAASAATWGIRFKSNVDGPTVALAGSIIEINTPVTGWNSVAQPSDADLGSEVQTDEAYRATQEAALGGTGSSNPDAIAASVLRVPGVKSVTVTENATATPTPEGIPAHAFETVISDGLPSDADDDQVAQAIWDTKPAGIQAYGLESGDAVDANDDLRTMSFTRVAKLDTYIEIELQTDSNFPGVDAVAAAILGYVPHVAEDVAASFVSGICFGVAGVRDVVDASGNLGVRVGLVPNPPFVSRLEIGATQQAIFSSERLVITTTVWIDD